MSKKHTAKKGWLRALKAAHEHDQWGQSIEATDGYTDVLKMLGNVDDLNLTVNEREIVAKSRAVVKERMEAITAGKGATTAKEVKGVVQAIEGLFTGKDVEVDIKVRSGVNIYADSKQNMITDFVENALLPPPRSVKPGSQTISIVIKSIGLKDAPTYIDPFITVSVVRNGKQIGPIQDTKKSHVVKDKHVKFEETVHIQTPLDEFTGGHSIFFEFKHYKPKKKKVSIRCFAFMEHDEILQAQKQKLTQVGRGGDGLGWLVSEYRVC
uniref:C2 Aida-type domain-containing protein n=1 Tax=Lotharella globosa TaxID=91324 RepID=A0A7S4DH32_9EUKA